jgi:hypothetical protein
MLAGVPVGMSQKNVQFVFGFIKREAMRAGTKNESGKG